MKDYKKQYRKALKARKSATESPSNEQPTESRPSVINPVNNLELLTPIRESAAESFLRNLELIRSGSDEVEFNSSADVDLE